MPAPPFRPARGLSNPHLQTIWPFLLRRGRRMDLERERLELPDGDFLDLDWAGGQSGSLALIIHGLEGCSQSAYVRGLMRALGRHGVRSVAMNFRGCSGQPNRLPKSYCAGETEDIASAVRHVRRRANPEDLFVVGYSLGGNAMLNWLASAGAESEVRGAVAVSVPFELREAAERMGSGASRLYQWYFLQRLKSSYRRKFCNRDDAPIPPSELERLSDFFAFDDAVTAPLHGYRGVDDYYRRASCRQRLRMISVPTLILHALDDPFMTPRAVPDPEELSDLVTLDLTPCGGHVGFVGGNLLAPRYWLEDRIPRFILTLSSNRE